MSQRSKTVQKPTGDLSTQQKANRYDQIVTRAATKLEFCISEIARWEKSGDHDRSRDSMMYAFECRIHDLAGLLMTAGKLSVCPCAHCISVRIKEKTVLSPNPQVAPAVEQVANGGPGTSGVRAGIAVEKKGQL